MGIKKTSTSITPLNLLSDESYDALGKWRGKWKGNSCVMAWTGSIKNKLIFI